MVLDAACLWRPFKGQDIVYDELPCKSATLLGFVTNIFVVETYKDPKQVFFKKNVLVLNF